MNTRKLIQLFKTTTLTGTRVAPGYHRNYFVPATRHFSTSLSWRSTMAHDKKCWQCQATNKPSALFCENKVCNVIQPIPASLDFFHLLQAGEGQEKNKPKFNIDLKALKKRFLILQQKAHPDSYSQAAKQELDYAHLQSSIINKAYNTLKNPLSRAQYILKQQGIEVSETDSLNHPELLMEVMELREELDEVGSEEELKSLKQRNDEKYQETVDKLQAAFDQQDYEKAKELATELQYWTSIQTAIHEWHP
ncbi:Co-chaperone HscB, C-terminal oligomerization domain-containing protein [Gilbertella persicaria]|uniref:Co-chaperone HscB, C-terminal oligomerization domain-containing protein n=1 Tax=Gilbertella persicaria TaxID=101096 RepID=UPI0022201503|nr:Co-chaperone HscB, C-terminal oligomerization domain-containing protein [Gilbertella persicaria]KAI8078062.1 Co-chaperone HscB, C-terminal oligomerization domain-containing protein [Gilbertella persicaria]